MWGVLSILSACFLWAFDTLIRYPLINSGVDAISIVFYEHLLLTLFFVVLFNKQLKDFFKAKLTHYFYFFIIGALGSAVATLAFTQAFRFLNPSLVIILQKLQPVFAILMAKFFLKERLGSDFLLWALLALLGGAAVSYQDILALTKIASFKDLSLQGSGLGYLLVAVSILGWGASTVFGKKLSIIGYGEKEIMAGRFFFGLLGTIPFVFLSPDIFKHNLEVYSKISLMVLISGLFAMFLYYQGLKKVTAKNATLAEMSFPFFAIIVNWIFLGASLSLIQIAGGILLMVSSIVIQIKRY